MAREQIIIDVELNADEVAQGLGEVAKRTSELKKENADLKKQMKAGTGDWSENAKKLKENELQLKTLKAAEKDLTGQLAATTQTNRTYSDSIDGVRAMTADLQRQYQSLTKAERESAGGKEMFNKLVELKQEVKDNAQSAGDFQDSVGNYPKVFDLSGTSIGKFQTMLQGFGGTAQTVGGVASNAFAGIKASAIAMGKAFLVPPILLISAILGAIVLVAKGVSDAFKKNDDAATNLQRAFAVFTPITEALSWAFDKLAVGVSKIALGFSKAVSGILSIIPAYRKAAKEADDLVKAQDDLEESERQYVKNSAKRKVEIANLKKDALDSEKFTAKEREAMLKKADDLEKQDLVENRNNLAKKYNQLVKSNKQQKDTSDAAKDAEVQALAAFYQAEEAYLNGTMRLQSKSIAAKKEQAAEEERIAKEAGDKAAERRARERKERIEQTEREIKEFDAAQKAKVKTYADAMAAIEALKTTVVEEVGDDDFGDVKKYLADLEEAKRVIAETNAIDSLAYQQGILDAEYEQAIENAKKIGISTTAIDAAYAEQKKQISEAETAAKLDMASDFAGNLSTIFGESTKLGKAAAAAQIAIDTYKGALAAYASMASVPIVGQALGIAAAAAVGVKGAKAIKDVYSVKETFPKPRFAGGGIVGGSSISGDMINARVNSGEMILNLPQQKRLFNMIATTGNSSQGGIDYELLAKTMSKLPSPVVVYKEFSDFGDKIVTFDEQIKI